MLKRIRIKNFQAHRSLTLDLDPHITTIVGPSDVGKSAVLRALRWVCFNKPEGDGFVTDGKDQCKVQITIDDHKVTRGRGKGGNTYQLDDRQLVAFGRGVPDLVSRVLNLDDVNFQTQHDAPYWFALTPGEVSRQINSIVDLGIIDSALSEIQRQRRDAAARFKGAEAMLQRSKTELESMQYVPALVAAYNTVETLETDVSNTVASVEQLACLTSRGVVIANSLERVTQVTTRSTKLLARFARHERVQSKIQSLDRLLVQTTTARTTIGNGRPELKATSKLHAQWTTTAQLLECLERHIERIQQKRDQIWQSEKKLKQNQALLPETCPTCGN